MIDRINGNNYTNTYKSNAVKKTNNEEAPKFLLGNEDEGVVWDRQDKNESDNRNIKKPENKLVNADLKDRLDISYSKNNDLSSNLETQDKDTVNLRDLVSNIGNGIKNLFVKVFNFIWYGDKADDSVVADDADVVNSKGQGRNLPKGPASTYKSSLNEAEKDKLIRESISRKDNDEMMRLLTEDYTKNPARNSTLLTRYDRQGRITGVNGADEDRILKGKNAINL